MNFGPVLDLNINPENPVIGARERSFSADVQTVISNAEIFIEAHNAAQLVCVPKHFPGHGSSDKDSHKGLTDISNSWTAKELIPFQTLIDQGGLEVIMTSHVYNANLDTLPATLSPKIIKDLLRDELKFDGVILSDDMQMRAISNFYNLETSIEKAIQSGVDMLMFSNNASACDPADSDCVEIPFDPEIAVSAIDYIMSLIENGSISEERINQSYQRILKLKNQL